MARSRVRGNAEALFKDAHGDFLCFDNVILRHGGLIGWPSLDPFTFRLRKAVPREKVVHFSFSCHSMLLLSSCCDSHVGITRLEHGRESCGFLLPPFSRAWFFEAAMQPHLHQRLLAIEFLSKPAQCLVNRLPFSELNFRHIPASICSERRCGKVACFGSAFPKFPDTEFPP